MVQRDRQRRGPDGLQDDDAANTAIQDLSTWAQTGAIALGDGTTSVGGVNGHSETYNGMSAAYGPNWQQSKALDIDQQLAAAAYNRDQQKCADDDDLTQLPNIISWYRSDVLFGHADDLSIPDLYACANFTLDFDSTIVSQFDTPDGFTGSWTNEYTVDGLTISPDSTGNETGTGFGSYVQASGVETATMPCADPSQGTMTTTITDEGGTGDDFTVTSLTLPTAAGESPVLTIDPGEPKEIQQVTIVGCSPTPPPSSVTNTIWVSFFRVAHAADYVNGGFALPLEPGGGSTYGTATFNNSPSLPGTGEGSEMTTVTVTLTPQPYPTL